MKAGRTLLFFIVLPLLAGGCSFARHDALGAIYNASKAVHEKNYEGLQEYVDVHALLEQCVNSTVEDVSRDGGLVGQIIGGVAALAGPSVVDLAERQIRSMVESGQLADYLNRKDVTPANLLFAKVIVLFGAHSDKNRFRILKRSTDDMGENISLEIKIRSDGPWAPVDLRAEKYKGHLRVVRIENLDAIKPLLLRESIAFL